MNEAEKQEIINEIKTQLSKDLKSETPDKEVVQQTKLKIYEQALKDIAAGKSVQEILSDLALKEAELPKTKTNLREWAEYWLSWIPNGLRWIGNNLAIITGLAVAISGFFFSYYQYLSNERQKQSELQVTKDELQITKAKTLDEMIDSLTSENPDVRRYAVTAMFTFYASDKDNKINDSELRFFANLGDPEALEEVASRLETQSQLEVNSNSGNSEEAKKRMGKIIEIKKKSSELYAFRAEKNINRADAEEKELNKEKNEAKRDLLKKSFELHLKVIENDIKKAYELDNQGILSNYLFGNKFYDEKKYSEALNAFSKSIKFVEEKYKNDKQQTELKNVPLEYWNAYLRSYLNLTIAYGELGKNEVCGYVNNTVSKYSEASLDIYLSKNEGEFHKFWKQCDSKYSATIAAIQNKK